MDLSGSNIALRASRPTDYGHSHHRIPLRATMDTQRYDGLANTTVTPIETGGTSGLRRVHSHATNDLFDNGRGVKLSLGFILNDAPVSACPEEGEATGPSHTLLTGFVGMMVSPTSTDGRVREGGLPSSDETRPRTPCRRTRERPRTEASGAPAKARAPLAATVPATSGLSRKLKATAMKPATERAKKTTTPMTYEERRLARKCTIDGCFNYTINKGLCFRHGGGKQCTVDGCDASAKVAGLCWKHGGSVQCNVKGCDRRGKSRGRCWAHGGGTKCQDESCEKVAVSNGFCWAHGGGKRCLFDGCQRPAYERTYNYCPKHYEWYKDGREEMEV